MRPVTGPALTVVDFLHQLGPKLIQPHARPLAPVGRRPTQITKKARETAVAHVGTDTAVVLYSAA